VCEHSDACSTARILLAELAGFRLDKISVTTLFTHRTPSDTAVIVGKG
jgi:hypothetical protein